MKLSVKNYISFFFLSVFMLLSASVQSQSTIYATMATEDALSFQDRYPNDIQILSSVENESAVILSQSITDIIRESVHTHGPGYIFRSSEENALVSIQPPVQRTNDLDFSITEDYLVESCLDMVDADNITETILELQNYGTRYHTKAQARQAVLDMQAKWDAMIAAAGRTDVRTRIFEHVNTTMPSVILTIDGATSPDEFVIVGGHMDSTSWDKDDAPGADDNASGMASLTEMIRILLQVGYVPNKTVEVMGFAAEEIGLVGSGEIAENYAQNGVNVLAFVQFDMTGYQGSNEDVYVSLDWYNNSQLNDYLVTLMNHYNNGGAHPLTYGFTECGYGCSDHASWAYKGYKTAFPFEAAFDDSNPNIHSPFDTYSFFGTGEHAAKFTKLGLEFIIEAAKSQTIGIDDFAESSLIMYSRDKTLFYDLQNTASKVNEISVFNIAGQQMTSRQFNNSNGEYNLEKLPQGFYVVQFVLENNQKITKKLILQ